MGGLCSFIVTRVLRREREGRQRGCDDEGRVWRDRPGAKEHSGFWKLEQAGKWILSESLQKQPALLTP